jgi:hypothetical protein
LRIKDKTLLIREFFLPTPCGACWTASFGHWKHNLSQAQQAELRACCIDTRLNQAQATGRNRVNLHHAALRGREKQPAKSQKCQTARKGRLGFNVPLGHQGNTADWRSTAFFAALARVLLVVGGDAALQTAHLAVAGGVAHAFGGDRAWGGFTFSFGTKFFGHDEWAPASW